MLEASAARVPDRGSLACISQTTPTSGDSAQHPCLLCRPGCGSSIGDRRAGRLPLCQRGASGQCGDRKTVVGLLHGLASTIGVDLDACWRPPVSSCDAVGRPPSSKGPPACSPRRVGTRQTATHVGVVARAPFTHVPAGPICSPGPAGRQRRRGPAGLSTGRHETGSRLLKTAVGCDDAEALAAPAARRWSSTGAGWCSAYTPSQPRRVEDGGSTAGRSTGSSAGRSGPAADASTWSMRSSHGGRRAILPDAPGSGTDHRPRRRRGKPIQRLAAILVAWRMRPRGPGRPTSATLPPEMAEELRSARPADLGPGGARPGAVRPRTKRPDVVAKGVTKKTGRRLKKGCLGHASGGLSYIRPSLGRQRRPPPTGGGRDADPDQADWNLRWSLQRRRTGPLYLLAPRRRPIRGERRVAAVRPLGKSVHGDRGHGLWTSEQVEKGMTSGGRFVRRDFWRSRGGLLGMACGRISRDRVSCKGVLMPWLGFGQGWGSYGRILGPDVRGFPGLAFRWLGPAANRRAGAVWCLGVL